jgi:hypothetical protein
MPIFLKFGGIGEDGDLNEAFLKIDSDFLKLSSAGADSFLKVEADATIKHDVNVIGGSFIKLSDDFLKISDGALKVDSFLIKLAGTTSDAATEGGPNPQADFLKLDTTLKTSAGDLAVLGSDFLKLDTAPDLAGFKLDELTVGSDFAKVGADMTDASGAFIKLGSHVIALGTGPNTNPPELDAAYKLLGGELDKISPAFDAVAFDWIKLSQDFTTLGGGGGTTLATSLSSPGSTDSTPGPLGTDFLKLEQDFLVLSQAIGGSAPGLKAVFDALIEHSGKHDELTGHADNMLGGPGGSGSNHG